MAADRRRRAIRACSIGGIAVNFDGSYRLGGGRDFVIEGDEYDSAFFDKTAKFLKYLPDIAVVGNLEYDHADIYPDMDVDPPGVPALRQPGAAARPAAARRRQRGGAGARGRARSCKVETFGLVRRRRLAGARPARSAETSTRVQRHGARGEPSGAFELPLLGAHNVRNALAAIAVGARRRPRHGRDGRRRCGASRACAGG